MSGWLFKNKSITMQGNLNVSVHCTLSTECILVKVKAKTTLIEGGECLILFGAESFIFQFAIQKFKDQDI